MKKFFVVLAVLVLPSLAQAAEGTTFDAAILSNYINGTGGLASKGRDGGVLQWDIRHTFKNNAYVDFWGSQSIQHPGTDGTFANELDFTVGKYFRLQGPFSAEAHAAYFDIANNRVFEKNGDLVNLGGFGYYQASQMTTVYGEFQQYFGVGTRGLPDGWKTGVGVRTTIGPVYADAVFYYNNFLARGTYAKLYLEPAAPLAKAFGGEARPLLLVTQPIGNYARSQHVVVGMHITFK